MQLRINAKQVFFCSAFSLTIIGILFVYSSSIYWGSIHYSNELPFYLKQAIYALAALVLFFLFVSRTITITEKLSWIFYCFSILLLILVLIPNVGLLRNGSRSWLGLAGFTIQPAELAKIATLMYLSFALAKRNDGKWKAYIKHFLIILAPTMLIMMQPDFGSAFLIIVAAFLLLFIGKYPLKIFTSIILVGIAALTGLILSAPYRLKRIMAFLDPWQDPLNSGFQAVQSLLAIGPGGMFGHGFLKSRQKYLYLPEPQNDFIFSIYLEEMGFIGGAALVFIFACFLISGFRLAMKSNHLEKFYMITALTALLSIQTILNMGVVVGLFPVTGVTLPFISYGGTSLLFTWFIVAIVLNLAKSQN